MTEVKIISSQTHLEDYALELGVLFQEFELKANKLTTNNPGKLAWGLQYLKHILKHISEKDIVASGPIGQQGPDVTILCADGGQNGSSGDEGWASVVDANKMDMIEKYVYLFSDLNLKKVNLPEGKRTVIVAKFDDVKKQQSQGAELLSMLAALRIALEMKNVKEIRSDSQTVVNFWSKGHIGAKSVGRLCQKKKDYINDVTLQRRGFESGGGQIVKISGDKNLADLGFHKK
jgi:ribonuclease HI